MIWNRQLVSIEKIREFRQKNQLITQPYFQRSLVWAEYSKAHFIESVLLGYPVPEIYVYKELIGDSTSYGIIDGQQRITALFSFLDDVLQLKKIQSIQFLDKKYTLLSAAQKNQLDSYEFSFVFIDYNDKPQIIDMYRRINKYTVNLNDQELRKAAYHDSEYLKVATLLSNYSFFELGKLFTTRKRQRMTDIEFVSELMCVQLEGIQDKKNNLDEFYEEYSSLSNKCTFMKNFIRNLNYIERMFNGVVAFSKTRFRQQSDFYSLFAVVNSLDTRKKELLMKNQKVLSEYFMFLDYMIEPESEIQILQEYAIKCVSQANTKNSRLFRHNLILSIINYIVDDNQDDYFERLVNDIKETYDFIQIDTPLDIKYIHSEIYEYYEQFV